MENLWNELKHKVVTTSSQVQSYEAIDRDVHRLCLNVENSIQLHKNIEYVWSLAFDEVVKGVQYWNSRKKLTLDCACRDIR